MAQVFSPSPPTREDHPIEPHDFWQAFQDAPAIEAPYQDRYPARLADGRVLALPIRPLAGTQTAIASLILNQASFAVEASLADVLARRIGEVEPDIVVGLPTLGLSLARLVAERLGHTRYVALGTSRKFWYDPDLSIPLSSITSPSKEKRLYIDPRMLALFEGRRVCLIDDVISTGTSMRAGLDLLSMANINPVVIGAAMLQTRRWTEAIASANAPVLGAFETPLLQKTPTGWVEAG